MDLIRPGVIQGFKGCLCLSNLTFLVGIHSFCIEVNLEINLSYLILISSEFSKSTTSAQLTLFRVVLKLFMSLGELLLMVTVFGVLFFISFEGNAQKYRKMIR